MFPVASFLDPTFEPEILYFDDRKILHDAMAKVRLKHVFGVSHMIETTNLGPYPQVTILPLVQSGFTVSTSTNISTNSFCFVNVPPAMLPVRLINVAQHGYCFYPKVPKPEDAAFQLIIELRHGEVSVQEV